MEQRCWSVTEITPLRFSQPEKAQNTYWLYLVNSLNTFWVKSNGNFYHLH